MSLFSKFKNKLNKTSNYLSSNILNSFQNKKVDNQTLEELESILISADISLDVVEKLINSVRKVKTLDQDITTVVLETSNSFPNISTCLIMFEPLVPSSTKIVSIIVSLFILETTFFNFTS